jgi:hypothetical protein
LFASDWSHIVANDTTPSFAQFCAYLQEMEGFELSTLGEGEMGVLRADDDGMTLYFKPLGTREVTYDMLAHWFDRLLVQRFLPLSLLVEDFGDATPLVGSLFLQLDGVRYEDASETLYWFETL